MCVCVCVCVYTQVQCNPSGPATHSKPSLLSTTQVPTGPPAIQTGHLHCQMLASMGLGCSKDDLVRRAGWRWLGATKIIAIPDPAQALPPNDPGDPLLCAFLAPGQIPFSPQSIPALSHPQESPLSQTCTPVTIHPCSKPLGSGGWESKHWGHIREQGRDTDPHDTPHAAMQGALGKGRFNATMGKKLPRHHG